METSTADSLNGLTIYIISCMLFVSIAMIYYGILLYILRQPSILDHETEKTIKWDRLVLLLYGNVFILFNASYFVFYYFT